MIVLIPAYEPGAHLVPLVRDLLNRDSHAKVVVVDDGSGPAFAHRFAEASRAGAHLVTHHENRGKGAALKSGFRLILQHWRGEDVVTADADGQHNLRDIERTAHELSSDAAHGRAVLVLGARAFRGDVPARSRFGNAVSRGLFRIAAGWRASDTQTGLRGIPAAMLPWLLDLPGDRFEYEIQMLLRLRHAGYIAREIPIETVYLEQNASSHFRPITDSLRVTVPLLLFAGSSLLAFLVDTVALFVLTALTGSLIGSIVGARLLSASVNFVVNLRFVFRLRGGGSPFPQALKYTGLAALLLGSNVVWMNALTELGLPLIAKVITEVVLFVTSYQLQRRFVFGRDAESPPYESDKAHLAASQMSHSKHIARTTRMNIDMHRFERTP